LPRFGVFVLVVFVIQIVFVILVVFIIRIRIVVEVLIEMITKHRRVTNVAGCHETGSVAGFGFSRLGRGYVVQK
jgi:hypothetical protein